MVRGFGVLNSRTISPCRLTPFLLQIMSANLRLNDASDPYNPELGNKGAV